MSRIDKEDYGVTSSANQRDIIKLKELSDKNPDASVVPSHHVGGALIAPLYKALGEGRDIQTYVFAESLFSMLDNMKCDNILNSDIFPDLLRNNQVGRLVDKKSKVSAEYAIVDGAFYLNAYYKTELIGFACYHPVFNEVDPSYKDGVQIAPQNPLVCFHGNIPPRLKERWSGYVKMLNRDFPNGIDFVDDGDLLYGKDWTDICDSGILVEDFKIKKNAIYYALKMFIYLKTAKEISQDYVVDTTPTYKRKRGYIPLNYIQIDATWNKNIDVNSPFPVSGHFRHQPKKDANGEWYKELIYIESFMKYGYHRKAKMLS